MRQLLEKLQTETLWRLLEDLAKIIETPDKSERFSFWYFIYKEIRSEIDRRMKADYEV